MFCEEPIRVDWTLRLDLRSFDFGENWMRHIAPIIATVFFFVAAAAYAQVTWSVEGRALDGSPFDAITPGTVIVLDITLRSSAPISGLGASLFGYDRSLVSVIGGTLSSHALAQLAVGPGVGFGGLDNTVQQLVETDSPRGAETQFFNGVSLTPAPANGSSDIGAVSGLAGGAQFQIMLAVLFPVSDGTVITVGTDPAFGDAVVLPDGSFGSSNNVSIVISVIPEPSTALLVGLGLAGLASVPRRAGRGVSS